MEGAWKQGERAGTGKGASLPFSWKTKQALNPFLVEPALLDARGTVVSGVPFPPSPFLRCSRAKTCPCVPDFCRASLGSAAGPRQPPLQAGTPQHWHFPGLAAGPYPPASPVQKQGVTSLIPSQRFCLSPCSSPADSSSAVGTEQLWAGGGRSQPLGTGWGCPCVTLVAGRPGSGWGGEAELLWQWLI